MFVVAWSVVLNPSKKHFDLFDLVDDVRLILNAEVEKGRSGRP